MGRRPKAFQNFTKWAEDSNCLNKKSDSLIVKQ